MKSKLLHLVICTFLVLFLAGLVQPVAASVPGYDDPPPPTERQPYSPDAGKIDLLAITTGVTPKALSSAMGIPGSQVLASSLNGSDPVGTGTGNSTLGLHFPTEGSTFTILSSGSAAYADYPNDSSSLSYQLDGINSPNGQDMVQLYLKLKAPAYAHCAGVDFAFYSEEFPEFVGSQFNDTFLIEKGASTFTIDGYYVNAPNNFAFDTEGNVISVNTVFGVSGGDTGTTYDGKTPLLRATTSVEPNSELELYFTIMDMGDSIYDSTVLLDKFFWSSDTNCENAAQADSDGDGLLDDWETNGLTRMIGDQEFFVDLPAMGANPQKKDIFVEADYMADDLHSHQFKTEAMALIIDSFANAPVSNPDNTTGIVLHVDNGPNSIMNPVTGELWGSLSECNAIAHDTDLGAKVNNNYIWTEFEGLQDANFSSARDSIFHYVIFAHNLGGYGSTSGISQGIPSSNFIVSLGSWRGGTGTAQQQAGTFMHELGHNLSLRHGGIDNIHFKPNFLSIMNYSFQTSGLYINGQEGNFDYSQFNPPALNELNLDEGVGLNGGVEIDGYGTRYYCSSVEKIITSVNGGIDWDCDNTGGETGIHADVNKDGSYSTLQSFDDWENLTFTGGAIGAPGAEIELPRQVKVDEINETIDDQIIKMYKVITEISGNVTVLVGSTIQQTVTLRHDGAADDTYTLVGSSPSGWANLAALPASVTLASGESATLLFPITIPGGVVPDTEDILSITATSQGNSLIFDTSSIVITAGAVVNDDIDAAIHLETGGGIIDYVETLEIGTASRTLDDPLMGKRKKATTGFQTVWYEITPFVNGIVQVSTAGSNYDTLLGVWQGERGSLTKVAYNDNAWRTQTSKARFRTIGGTKYYIEIASMQITNEATLNLSVKYTPTSLPNNLIGGARSISYAKALSGTYTNKQDVYRANTSFTDPLFPSYSNQLYQTVWYRFIPTKTGFLFVDTAGSNYDTVLGVWSGSPKNLILVDWDDNTDGATSRVVVDVTKGKVYWIEVANTTPDSTVPSNLQINAAFTQMLLP